MATDTGAIDAVKNFDSAAVIDFLQTKGLAFGLDIIAALVIFIVGRIIIRFVVSALRKAMQRGDVDKTLETFVCNVVRIGLLVVVVLAAVSRLGVETTSLIAIFGAAGLAVGLALQGSLSNFAAGVLIVLFRPYRIGDFIEAAGIAGTVELVQILTTSLTTPDNKKIIVPNSQIMDSVITNYSANGTRRVDMVVGVGYGDNLDQVKKVLEDLVGADERILAEPACTIAVSELAESSVNLIVRPWVATADYWVVRWDLTEAIKKRFDHDGISIPFPQRDVHLHNVTNT